MNYFLSFLLVVLLTLPKVALGEGIVADEGAFDAQAGPAVESSPLQGSLNQPYLGTLTALPMELTEEKGKVFRKYMTSLDENAKSSYLVGIPVKVIRTSPCDFYVGQQNSKQDERFRSNVIRISTMGAKDILNLKCEGNEPKPVSTFLALEFGDQKPQGNILTQTVILESEGKAKTLLVHLNIETETVEIEQVH